VNLGFHWQCHSSSSSSSSGGRGGSSGGSQMATFHLLAALLHVERSCMMLLNGKPTLCDLIWLLLAFVRLHTWHRQLFVLVPSQSLECAFVLGSWPVLAFSI
jgi:hypothetical protein